MQGRGSLSSGKENGISGCCCLECCLQLGDAVGIGKVKTPLTARTGWRGQGSKGNALTLNSQIPWRRPCQHSWSSQLQATLFPSPQATVGQAGTHSLQPSSPVCNVWLWQAPGLQDGKGGLVQARGSLNWREQLWHAGRQWCHTHVPKRNWEPASPGATGKPECLYPSCQHTQAWGFELGWPCAVPGGGPQSLRRVHSPSI